MAKNIFDIALKVRQQEVNNESTNVVFIGFHSKAELLYKNIPCEVVRENYRYVLLPKGQVEHGNIVHEDFYELFEYSLKVHKTLKESTNAKIVFVVDSGSIFDGRAREFTSWLELIDKSFGSKNLLSSSCLVVESVPSDSDPILEVQSFINSPCGRISALNLKLLNEWISSEKVVLIPKFTKNDLGNYNSELIRNQLDNILSKCGTLSYLDSKPFLPSDFLDFQKDLYQEHLKLISNKSEIFVIALQKTLSHNLEQLSKLGNLSNFKDSYNKILSALESANGLNIYQSMLTLCQLDFTNDALQGIATEVETLEQQFLTITELMPETLRWHNPETQVLVFNNKLHNIKDELAQTWGRDILKTEESINNSLLLYKLFDLNEDYKVEMRNLGVKLYCNKIETTAANVEGCKLIESYEEFNTNLKKLQQFCRSNTKLMDAFKKTLEGYSELTELHKIIYQSVLEYLQSSIPLDESFAHLYVKHTKDIYSKLYSSYGELMLSLEKEYAVCVNTREDFILGGSCAAAGVATVTGVATIACMVAETVTFGAVGIPIPIFTLLGIMISGGTGTAAVAGYKREEIAENFELFKIGFAPVEKYYKQLPKDLREAWAEINMSPVLVSYLKEAFPENKIYAPDEVPGQRQLMISSEDSAEGKIETDNSLAASKNEVTQRTDIDLQVDDFVMVPHTKDSIRSEEVPLIEGHNNLERDFINS
jgi:hypothetical protein